MEQTKVNQFFTARKNASNHASKRRKLDVDNNVSRNRAVPITLSRKSKRIETSTKVTKKANDLSLKQLLSASPLVINTEVTNSEDDHVSPKRKKTKQNMKTAAPVKTVAEQSSAGSVIDSNNDNIRGTGNVPIASDINNQAKLVMFSRGKALVNARLRSSQKDVPKSPSKVSQVLETLSPKKDNNQTQEQPSSSQRNRLRNKYAHLLKDSSAKSTTTSEPVVQVPVLSKDAVEPVAPTVRSSKKFNHLTEKAAPLSFILPTKYKRLVETFRCVDSVLFLLHQRSEICTFGKLKKSVQAMTSREFTNKNLAVMKTVYPNGFIFRQEKNLHSGGSKSSDYQLTIEANFKDCSNSSKINSSVLVTRRLKFENKLLSITKAHHQKFLKKLNLKLSDDEIRRWHPHFKLEEVPDIEYATLPQVPTTKQYACAADILQGTMRHTLAPKVGKSLTAAASKTKSEITETSGQPKKLDASKYQVEESKTKVNNKLKGVSTSILERIREKERKKMQAAMTRDPVQELRLSRIERLPEMTRILKAYFVAEKKVAITLEDCVQKLTESYGSSLQNDKITDHVHLLAELAPDWLTITTVRQCPYVKLTKSYDINNVLNSLRKIKSEEEFKT